MSVTTEPKGLRQGDLKIEARYAGLRKILRPKKMKGRD